MKAPLRVALTLFSFEALQSWAILAGGAMVAIGILAHKFEMSAIFAMLVVLRPGMFGGQELRIMSTPVAVHLRPHARLWMMMGAAATITLVALVFTAPVLVFQLAGLRVAGGLSVFDLPAAATFRFCWGITALLWIWTFFTSNFPLLLGFSWVPLGAATAFLESLHIPSGQLADALFIIGATGWTGFSWWYLACASITQPRQHTARTNGHPALDLRQQLARIWYGNSRRGTSFSRLQALGQYLGGARPTLAPLLAGAATVVAALGLQLSSGAEESTPIDFLMFLSMSTIFSSPALVARARMLWLRAGLDRDALFLAVERQALRGALAMLVIPVVVLVTMSLMHRPGLALPILLYAATQVVFNVLFLHAGLTATRGSGFESVLVFIALGLPFLVMSIILQPGRGAFVWTYVATIGVSAVLTLLLRRCAMRAWRQLDWRVAGPLPAGIGQQKS